MSSICVNAHSRVPLDGDPENNREMNCNMIACYLQQVRAAPHLLGNCKPVSQRHTVHITRAVTEGY